MSYLPIAGIITPQLIRRSNIDQVTEHIGENMRLTRLPKLKYRIPESKYIYTHNMALS